MHFISDIAEGRKQCSKCSAVKALSAFSRASKEKSGYKSACKACIKLDAAEYYLRIDCSPP